MLLVNIFMVLLGCLCEKTMGQKRLLLHSSDDIAQEFQLLRNEIDDLKNNHTMEIQSLKNTQSQELQAVKSVQAQEISALKSVQAQEISSLKSVQAQEISSIKSVQAQEISSLQLELTAVKQNQGSTYVRWGKTTCAGNGTKKVYSGFTAGSAYDIDGGASSYVCLPQHPTWANYVDGKQDRGGKISGTEYETNAFKAFPQNMQNQDAQCCVCRSPRPTTIMIPGKTYCYTGWTMEYTGYLMTGYYGHTGGTDYACVDKDPEAEYHGEADQNGKLLYFTEVNCGSLPCQEYPDGRELACVVCSK